MQRFINYKSNQIISQIPGILNDFDLEEPIPFIRLHELFRDPRILQFMRPGKVLKSMCSPALTLRNVLEGQGDPDACRELLKNLENFPFLVWEGDEMVRRLLRMQDLCDGGGLGFTVEIFFFALSQLLSTPTSSSAKSHSALYAGTFRAITSDWNKHKDSLGTQKLLLNIAILRAYQCANDFPDHVVDEFLLLLGNIFEGQTGPHIDNARQFIESFEFYDPGKFKERVLRVFTPGVGTATAP